MNNSSETTCKERETRCGSGSVIVSPTYRDDYVHAEIVSMFQELVPGDDSTTAERHGKGEALSDEEGGLTPEKIEKTMTALSETHTENLLESEEDPNDPNFLIVGKYGFRMQNGMDFPAFELALGTPARRALLTIAYNMLQAGARPSLVSVEDGKYGIAETFLQTLPERADSVYDKEAEKIITAGGGHCNGNAVGQSKVQGIPLMVQSFAKKHFVPFRNKNRYCDDYLQASKEERKDGCAPFLRRYYGEAGVCLGSARFHCADRGWRGAAMG